MRECCWGAWEINSLEKKTIGTHTESARERKRKRVIVNYVKLIKLYINVHLKLGDLEFYNAKHTGVRTHIFRSACMRRECEREKYRWVRSTILLLVLSLLFQFGLSRDIVCLMYAERKDGKVLVFYSHELTLYVYVCVSVSHFYACLHTWVKQIRHFCFSQAFIYVHCTCMHVKQFIPWKENWKCDLFSVFSSSRMPTNWIKKTLKWLRHIALNCNLRWFNLV